MKKYIVTFVLAISMLAVPQAAVFAQGDQLSQDIAQKSGYGSVTSNTLSETIGKIIKIALGLLGTVFLVLTVYAGFLWMTARGEEEKVTKATGILRTAIIGLIIILASYSITYFVLDSIFKATA